jgi:histidyl-tRNA synthetase
MANKSKFQAVRGTRDLLPPETALWNHVEGTARHIFSAYNFGEIRTPEFEARSLFARSVGDETDIVSKEMYLFEIPLADYLSYIEGIELSGIATTDATFAVLYFKFCVEAVEELKKGRIPSSSNKELLEKFESRREDIRSRLVDAHADLKDSLEFLREIIHKIDLGEQLAMRPEGTASVCRAYIENSLQQLPQPVKLYYIGPMFRRERPQKGRYRQFYQIGAEVLGGQDSPAIDAEVIEMLMTFFDKLELKGLELNINSIGHKDTSCRLGYVKKLREELGKFSSRFGEDSARRIDTNPLRVLDSKAPNEQALIETLPKITDYICDACKAHYESLKTQLQLRGIFYRENWRLVRGLDYYMRTTFEITAKGLGSQNAVCGGGRYDGLVEELGGPPTKGIGFAIGEDRLILSLQEQAREAAAAQGTATDGAVQSPLVANQPPLIFIAWMGHNTYATAVRAAKDLRNAGFPVEVPPTELKFGKALGQADKVGAQFALILGENEVSEGSWTLKNLTDGNQIKLPEPELIDHLRNLGPTRQL